VCPTHVTFDGRGNEDLAPKPLTTGHSGSPTVGTAKLTSLQIVLNSSNQVDHSLVKGLCGREEQNTVPHNVEGPGNGADRLPISDEFSGQFPLIWSHFLGTSERAAAGLGGQSVVSCSA